jgi:rhamnogalacturonyl hydrolase YesR
MSDRSYAQLTFYRVEPDEVEPIARILGGHGILYDPSEGADLIRTGDEIIDEELVLGELAEALTQVARDYPTAVFWGSQDARYEFTGDLLINEPVHGFFHAYTDNSGDVTFRVAEIEELVNADPLITGAALLADLWKRSGEPNLVEIRKWADAQLEQIRRQNAAEGAS